MVTGGANATELSLGKADPGLLLLAALLSLSRELVKMSFNSFLHLSSLACSASSAALMASSLKHADPSYKLLISVDYHHMWTSCIANSRSSSECLHSICSKRHCGSGRHPQNLQTKNMSHSTEALLRVPCSLQKHLICTKRVDFFWL